MKILVFNSGSSSIKYQLFEMPAATVLTSGEVEKIGEAEDTPTQNVPAKDKEKSKNSIANHQEGNKQPTANIREIQQEDGPVKILEIPTNEGLKIAQETMQLLRD